MAAAANNNNSSSFYGGSGRTVKVIPLQHPSPSSPPPPSTPRSARWRSKLRGMSAVEWMELFLPCTRWIRTYKWREYLQVDLMAGISVGVMLVPQVGFSLAFVIYQSANPHIAVLGRLPGTTVYRNTLQYPEAYTYNGIVVVRIDAPIYFANISYIKDRLREYELNVSGTTKRGSDVEKIYFVILEMSPVTYIDSSAVQALKDLHQEYRSRGIQIAIANPNREVHLSLSKSGLIDLVGQEWCFVRVHDAVQVCLQHVQSLNGTIPNVVEQAPNRQRSFLQGLWKQGGDDSNPDLEPLLPQKEV